MICLPLNLAGGFAETAQASAEPAGPQQALLAAAAAAYAWEATPQRLCPSVSAPL